MPRPDMTGRSGSSSRPPRLKLLEQIRGKSLEEFDELMLQLQQDARDTSEIPLETRIVIESDDNSDIGGILSDASSGSIWEP